MTKKTYEVTFNDVKKGSADFRQVVEPLYREEATKVIQSFFRHYQQYKELSRKNSDHLDPEIEKKIRESRSKMLDNTLRMKKLQEPVDIRFSTELARHIKADRYDLIHYAEPDFTRHLFTALRMGNISMNEMMTAKLMFESLTCFNKGKMPENTAQCFSTFALDDEKGPYRPEREISHWSEAERQQLKEKITGNKKNNQYYTINLPHHQMIGFLYKKLVDLGSDEPDQNFVSLLRAYFKASQLNSDDKSRALDFLNSLHFESESGVKFLIPLLKKYEPSVTRMIDRWMYYSNNAFGLSRDELERERASIDFLVALDNVDCEVPSVCRSPQYDESDPDSPVLCFILLTIDTFNTLQSVAHGEDATIPTPLVGKETVRMIRAYDEIPALKTDDGELEHLSEAQHLLKTLYPMTAKIKSPSRPIEISHPDTAKTEKPHGYKCHDFLLSWHDLFHAWRNGSNNKPLIRKLRGLHDEKGGLAKDKSGMSKGLWELTDIDFDHGQRLRNLKHSAPLEAWVDIWELKQLIAFLKAGGFDFNKALDDNYLLTYSCAKYPDEWNKLIDLTTLYYYASEVPGAPAFFKQQQSTENYLRLHPDASITEVILNDLLQPQMEGDRALLDSLRSRNNKDIFYWSKNTGLYFEKSLSQKHALIRPDRKLRSYSPNEIRAILSNLVDKMDAFEKNETSSLAVDLPLNSRVLQPDPLKRAIEYAMAYEKPALFIDLLQGGNDLNHVNVEFGSTMMTPIHWAIRHGHVELIRQLLMKSKNKDENSLRGYFRFIDPSSEKAPEILKILVENGANRNESIAYAVKNDMPQLLIDLINDGDNLNVTVPYDGSSTSSPIEWAIQHDHVELIQALLATVQYTNNKDSQGKSLMGFINGKYVDYYLSEKTLETLKLLLDHRVDINEKNHAGETILYKAVTDEDTTDINITKRLIDLGARVDVVNNEGKTPLHCVKNALAAEAILNAGANVHAKSNDGKTPLHYTANPTLAKMMISRGANVNEKDHYGKTPLDVILGGKFFYGDLRGLKETVSIFIDSGTHLSALTSEGKRMIQDRLKKEYDVPKSADRAFCEKLLNMISDSDFSHLVQKNPVLFDVILTQGNTQKISALLKSMPSDEARKALWAALDATILLDCGVKNPVLFTMIPATLLFEKITSNDYNAGFSILHTAACHDHKKLIEILELLPKDILLKALDSKAKTGRSLHEMLTERGTLLKDETADVFHSLKDGFNALKEMNSEQTEEKQGISPIDSRPNR